MLPKNVFCSIFGSGRDGSRFEANVEKDLLLTSFSEHLFSLALCKVLGNVNAAPSELCDHCSYLQCIVRSKWKKATLHAIFVTVL